MSFPSEIQNSIRAQLADCLVGVVCQRLHYLDRWQLRVPLCEVLLPNSGARGTIRGGQFGQIANVIQSGGEEGMWTFERYQRWIEQQKEWVRPVTPAPVAADGGIVRAATRLATPAGRPSRPAARPAAAPKRPEEIEIDEPLDLDEIAALARKIEQSTPQR
jgi:twitching motility protein PilT